MTSQFFIYRMTLDNGFFYGMATNKSASVLCCLENKIKSKTLHVRYIDCRVDMIKPKFYSLTKKNGKGINFVHRRAVMEKFYSSQTSCLGFLVEHSYRVEQLLTAHFLRNIKQGLFIILNGNLGQLTLVVEKQHLNYTSVAHISTQNFCHFCWNILNYFDFSPTRKHYIRVLTHQNLFTPFKITALIQNFKIGSLNHTLCVFA